MTVNLNHKIVAYFTMEAALESAMPTYSGGLGVLAGDTLRAAADLGVEMVGVTLLHRQGFFRQHLEADGHQTESAYDWDPHAFLQPLDARVSIPIEGRRVAIRAWRYLVSGSRGHVVPVYLLDCDLPENDPDDRSLTGQLYGGDYRYRLRQEAILGIGGVAMLRALGHHDIETFHMNEGHCALLTLALLDEAAGEGGIAAAGPDDVAAVRDRCVFTTHTPVPAGHDRFALDLVRIVLGDALVTTIEDLKIVEDEMLNMTRLGLFFSRFANAVAWRHATTARTMYPDNHVYSITNGVHTATWVSDPFAALYDRETPQWRFDPTYLRHALNISLPSIQEAHRLAKSNLLALVEQRTGQALDPAALTIGFARRAASYKRADLVFSDLARLNAIAAHSGRLQFVFAGKAHPHDEGGKALIRRVFEARSSLNGAVSVVYLEEHDMALGKQICAGVDLWLNNPNKPQEASGTSGMKAAMNGVPSLSVLDGWWPEGWVEGVTGWSIGGSLTEEPDPAIEADYIYRKLQETILPLYYEEPEEYARVMRTTIALNGSHFTAQRMVAQYCAHAYRVWEEGPRYEPVGAVSS